MFPEFPPAGATFVPSERDTRPGCSHHLTPHVRVNKKGQRERFISRERDTGEHGKNASPIRNAFPIASRGHDVRADFQGLEGRLAVFREGQVSACLRLSGPHGLCRNYATAVLTTEIQISHVTKYYS